MQKQRDIHSRRYSDSQMIAITPSNIIFNKNSKKENEISPQKQL
jgi:hypothetical protein